MKKILIFIFLLFNLNIYSQTNELREVTLSPNEKFIAFTYYIEKVLDVFIYDLEKDSIARITNSSDLNFDQQYKTFLNWIDNERLIFISKHNDLAQQYILNIKTNTFDLESSSSDHEYNLEYLKANNKTYYTSSRKGKDPLGTDTVPANEVWEYYLINYRTEGVGLLDKDNYEVVTNEDGEVFHLHSITSGENEGNYMAIQQYGKTEDGYDIYEYQYVVDKDKVEDFKKGKTEGSGYLRGFVKLAKDTGNDGKKSN